MTDEMRLAEIRENFSYFGEEAPDAAMKIAFLLRLLDTARSERDAALSRVDSALDDLLARYPASITEWADAVRAARAALSPPEYPPEQI